MPVKKICAWHKKYFGFELVTREGTEPATHGICKECSAILEGEFSVNRRERNERITKQRHETK